MKELPEHLIPGFRSPDEYPPTQKERLIDRIWWELYLIRPLIMNGFPLCEMIFNKAKNNELQILEADDFDDHFRTIAVRLLKLCDSHILDLRMAVRMEEKGKEELNNFLRDNDVSLN